MTVSTRTRTGATPTTASSSSLMTGHFTPTKRPRAGTAAAAATAATTNGLKTSKKRAVLAEHSGQQASGASPPPSPAPPAKKAKKTRKAAAGVEESAPLPLPTLSPEEIRLCTTTILPPLTFDVEAGKRHLVAADPRFASLVERIPMRVFEQEGGDDDEGEGAAPTPPGKPKELDLFKTLVTSILGQQVSWLAARAILYKFVRLWSPSLPERPDFATLPRDQLPFPTPLQVCAASVEQLRSAGLSGQKVKYVKDIAHRCSDGRLDVRRLTQMPEDDVVRELVQIKGVGIWTAQMLLIFALRRPDVLPVGDLGVQRGVLLLWAAGHKGPAIKTAKARPAAVAAAAAATTTANEAADKIQDAVEVAEHGVDVDGKVITDAGLPSSALPAATVDRDASASAPDSLPTIPAHANLTPTQLLARKNGTKTKSKQYLTPEEMTALCETWQPYRSLASVIMWGLVDA